MQICSNLFKSQKGSVLGKILVVVKICSSLFRNFCSILLQTPLKNGILQSILFKVMSAFIKIVASQTGWHNQNKGGNSRLYFFYIDNCFFRCVSILSITLAIPLIAHCGNFTLSLIPSNTVSNKCA